VGPKGMDKKEADQREMAGQITARSSEE